MCEESLNKFKNEERNINEQIFRYYFLYQAPSYLSKVLCDSDEIKNDKIIKNSNKGLIELRNSINSEEIPKKENKKINKKINKWNIEILTLKQTLQRVPIALATLKVSNISERVLNEIRKVIYSLYWEKKLLKMYATI